MNTLSTYHTIYETAIRAAEQLLFRYKAQITEKDTEDIILSTVNYNDLLYRVENMIDTLKQQKVRYKFDKMDREEFEALVSNDLLGRKSKIITVGFAHKISDIDTLQSISEQYSITVSNLLAYNKLSNQDFEDLKEQSGVIQIPRTVDLSGNTAYNDIMVVGSHSGEKAWGIDWANEIVYDPDTQDIEFLSNQETLLQGVQNAFGEKGDIPGHPDQVIEIQAGSDLDSELFDLMVIAQLQTKLLKDRRLKDIIDIQITTGQGSKTINVVVTPINSEDPLVATIKNVPII